MSAGLGGAEALWRDSCMLVERLLTVRIAAKPHSSSSIPPSPPPLLRTILKKVVDKVMAGETTSLTQGGANEPFMSSKRQVGGWV